MRYWWVNQNQTFRQEIEGGYLWSPKRNKNGHRNPFYEFMRDVAPGDIVFSFLIRELRRSVWSAATAARAPSRRSSAPPALTGARSAGVWVFADNDSRTPSDPRTTLAVFGLILPTSTRPSPLRATGCKVFISQPSARRWHRHFSRCEPSADVSGSLRISCYFPMQKVLKIAPRRSSLETSPVISPSAAPASRRSSATSSGAWPAPIA